MRKAFVVAAVMLGLIRPFGATFASASGTDSALLNATTSYYMNTADPVRLMALGCQAGAKTVGRADLQDGLIILMFGAPQAAGAVEGATVYHGTGAAGSDFASVRQIELGGEAFISGYLSCATWSAKLNLVFGTSNWGAAVTQQHGAAWGAMVNDVSSWISGFYFGDRVAAFGGSDIETDWSKPSVARAWVDGYLSANAPDLYDFGDAGGCPTKDSASPKCNNGWTVDDVWYVTWGSGGRRPLPQIYNAAQAKQWYQLKRYSAARVKDGYLPMTLAGVLTMSGDCRQDGGCGSAFNFTPEQASRTLSDLLSPSPDTSQNLHYLTDIKKAWLP